MSEQEMKHRIAEEQLHLCESCECDDDEIPPKTLCGQCSASRLIDDLAARIAELEAENAGLREGYSQVLEAMRTGPFLPPEMNLKKALELADLIDKMVIQPILNRDTEAALAAREQNGGSDG